MQARISKRIICLLTVCLLCAAMAAPCLAADEAINIHMPSFPVRINGVGLNNAQEEYPFFVYNDITYLPLTYYGCQLLGLDANWSEETGLVIQTGAVGSYVPTPRVSSGLSASIATGRIVLNGTEIDNSSESYPFLLFRDVTYMPMTWRNVHDLLGCSYAFDSLSGLTISASGADDTQRVSRLNYYGSDGTLRFCEGYTYYDTGLLCARTVYNVYDDGSLSSMYSFLYLYDSAGTLTDTRLSGRGYDAQTGEVHAYRYSQGVSEEIVIRPADENIDQAKFGVDPARTETIYGAGYMIPTDTSSDWAQAYLRDVFSGDEYTDMTVCQLIFVNDDDIPELLIDHGYGYAGARVYTSLGGNTDSVYFDHGYATWIPRANRLHTAGGHMDEYTDYFYAVDEGRFAPLLLGQFGAENNAHVTFDADGNPVYLYYLDGAQVSKAQYLSAIADVMDATQVSQDCLHLFTYDQCKALLESLVANQA